MRRKDGSIIRIGFSPYISIIQKHCMNNENWNNIIRMCYVTNKEPVWATCALLALQNDQLEPLQKALCALGDIERVQYIKKVRSRKRSEVSRCLSSKIFPFYHSRVIFLSEASNCRAYAFQKV